LKNKSRHIAVFIPARGGSKGIPNKNIIKFAGKPLILHTIEYALESELVNEIIVSTDDDKISIISKEAKANVIKRPDEISGDSASTESAIKHYIDTAKVKPSIIILLQATSPIRPKDSLDNVIKYFKKNNFDSLLSISPTHRFFWRINKDNTIYSEYDYQNRQRRQDLSKKDLRFVENGSLYIFTVQQFNENNNRLGGNIGYVEWPEEFSYEIDSYLDFEFVENIYKNINS